MRIDVYLFEKGYAISRTRARMMIEAGDVSVNGIPVLRPAFAVEGDEDIQVTDSLRYVSRGGLKLEAALDAFSVSPHGRAVLDIGASSGGFTDCVLQRGAKLVYAVDSGSGQLVPSLRTDPRVICRENCNARYLKAGDFAERPTLAVMDVSFISQTLIHPAVSAVLPSGGEFIALIKPQFEAGRAAVGRGGIVKKESDRRASVARVVASAQACGFQSMGVIPSPILGGDGNTEYLGYFIKTGGAE